MPTNHCAVVADIWCSGAEGGPTGDNMSTCYRCGETVCRNPACSLLTRARTATRRHARIRICTSCLAQERPEAEVDALVSAAEAALGRPT